MRSAWGCCVLRGWGSGCGRVCAAEGSLCVHGHGHGEAAEPGEGSLARDT